MAGFIYLFIYFCNFNEARSYELVWVFCLVFHFCTVQRWMKTTDYFNWLKTKTTWIHFLYNVLFVIQDITVVGYHKKIKLGCSSSFRDSFTTIILLYGKSSNTLFTVVCTGYEINSKLEKNRSFKNLENFIFKPSSFFPLNKK